MPGLPMTCCSTIPQGGLHSSMHLDWELNVMYLVSLPLSPSTNRTFHVYIGSLSLMNLSLPLGVDSPNLCNLFIILHTSLLGVSLSEKRACDPLKVHQVTLQ